MSGEAVARVTETQRDLMLQMARTRFGASATALAAENGKLTLLELGNRLKPLTKRKLIKKSVGGMLYELTDAGCAALAAMDTADAS